MVGCGRCDLLERVLSVWNMAGKPGPHRGSCEEIRKAILFCGMRVPRAEGGFLETERLDSEHAGF